MKICPFCKNKPDFDKDVKRYYDSTPGCPIQGLMFTRRQWEKRVKRRKR